MSTALQELNEPIQLLLRRTFHIASNQSAPPFRPEGEAGLVLTYSEYLFQSKPHLLSRIFLDKSVISNDAVC